MFFLLQGVGGEDSGRQGTCVHYITEKLSRAVTVLQGFRCKHLCSSVSVNISVPFLTFCRIWDPSVILKT